MSDLYVIEAPGKARQIEQILRSLGHDAVVQATKGHLYSMPDSLTPLGINSQMHEFARAPRDHAIVARLRDAARGAERLFIATDADQEGDAIAWDVAELLRDLHPEPLRVRLKGMDRASVAEALANCEDVRQADATPARTRAIVDRLIGAVFSRDGIAVGRVGTALLGLVQQSSPSVERLHLVAPAADGGRPWLAEVDVSPPLSSSVARQLAELSLPALGISRTADPASPTPSHMGDIMVRAGDRLDLAPREVETSMQRLYEAGRLSYPRSGSRGMSNSVSRKLQRMIRQAGYRYDSDTVAEKAPSETHDAPYPIGAVDLSKNPERMGSDEGVRTMIARDLVRSGQSVSTQSADAAKLTHFLREKGFQPEVVKLISSLQWRRDQGPRFPDQNAWPESQVIRRRPDTVLLEAAVKAGLGRPSTWAKHVETFMQRGLVDQNLALTDKGKAWIAGSPAELLDVRMSAAIETACERSLNSVHQDPERDPWECMAERIVMALPEKARKPLLQAVASEPMLKRSGYAHDIAAADAVDQAPRSRLAELHQASHPSV